MKVRTAVAALAVTLSMSSCAALPLVLPSTSPAPSPARSAPPAPTLEPTEPSPSPEEDVELSFGDTARWDDGIEVKVGKPKEFTPGEFADYDQGADHQFKIKVTVTNDTGSTIDPSELYVTATTADREATQIFDGETVGSYPSTKLRAGRDISFNIGFSVNDGEFVLEVTPDYDHDSVLFIGTVQ